MPRLRPILLAFALLVAGMPAMAGSSNSSQQQQYGNSSSNGQMQQGQMQNGGQQMQGRTQQNNQQEPPKPGFKVTVQHSGDRKTVGNYSSGRTQRAAPVNPASKPFRTMADMAYHNRKIEACLAFCSISHKNWENECIAKAGPQYPCGSLGASWYYQCQHGCANGK